MDLELSFGFEFHLINAFLDTSEDLFEIEMIFLLSPEIGPQTNPVGERQKRLEKVLSPLEERGMLVHTQSPSGPKSGQQLQFSHWDLYKTCREINAPDEKCGKES
ncbi:hypothetical protein DUI87_18355 [Hirundo rustica rustica]|uniref:Uncharacterized protein n=1 Tax=Hirundo rustica rustica TaxID=333673 RepID=A0A3M0JYC2_HIRRU|nr:hypothetical protein DUI87_18355 [Hirundo rustica rustica]